MQLDFKPLFVEEPLTHYAAHVLGPWWVGYKLDGEFWEVHATVSEETVSFQIKNAGVRRWSNTDMVYTYHHGALLSAMKAAFTKSGTYLCEVHTGDGKYDSKNQIVAFNNFQRVVSDGNLEKSYGQLRLMVHDVVECEGRDLLNVPLRERKTILQQAIAGNPRVYLEQGFLCASIAEIRARFNEVVSHDYEGIVVKPLDLPFIEATWLKMKILHTTDVAVFALTKTDGLAKNGFSQSYLIGVYRDSRVVYLNKVGTGFSNAIKKQLTAEVLKNQSRQDKDFIYCNPTIVLEIAYQNVSRDAQTGELALRFPRLMRIRTDKLPAQCNYIQLQTDQFISTLDK